VDNSDPVREHSPKQRGPGRHSRMKPRPRHTEPDLSCAESPPRGGDGPRHRPRIPPKGLEGLSKRVDTPHARATLQVPALRKPRLERPTRPTRGIKAAFVDRMASMIGP